MPTRPSVLLSLQSSAGSDNSRTEWRAVVTFTIKSFYLTRFIFTRAIPINLSSVTVLGVASWLVLPGPKITFKSSYCSMKAELISLWICAHHLVLSFHSRAENESLFHLCQLDRYFFKSAPNCISRTRALWNIHQTFQPHISIKDAFIRKDKEKRLIRGQRCSVWKWNWKANKMAANTHTLRAREERHTHPTPCAWKQRSLVSVATSYIKASQYLTVMIIVSHILTRVSYSLQMFPLVFR